MCNVVFPQLKGRVLTENIEEGVSIILWQLRQYQHVIRNWDRHLDAYELKVVMQVLDRTIGWQRREATFRPHVMLNGDRLYSGFGKTMSRSKLMKVLADLERRGVITRTPDDRRPGLKSYSLNLAWQPTDESVATGQDDVSNGDGVVSQGHCLAFEGDSDVSDGDPREAYRDNTIVASISENTIGDAPEPSAPAHRVVSSETLNRNAGRGHVINPPPRTRRSAAR